MNEPKLAPRMPPWMQEYVRRYLETDGAEGHMWKSRVIETLLPMLILTTTGRKSGQRYRNPLLYGKTNNAYVIVASNRGATVHPGWYLNLVAHPDVEVQVLGDKFKARARTAAGAERAALWEHMADIYPPYNEYQKTAGREIPVVVLEPVRT